LILVGLSMLKKKPAVAAEDFTGCCKKKTAALTLLRPIRPGVSPVHF
jgi:hypothetical protein